MKMKDNPVDLLKLIEYNPERVVPPLSWVGHVPFANFLVELVKPPVIVELGTHSGNSLCAFAQSVKSSGISARVFAVDTWQGDEHAGFYSSRIHSELKAYTERHYSFVSLLRKTFDEALSDFSDESIDLLHIDGLHTYDAVKHDFETWLPKMKPTGIVLFHDVSVRREGFGVFRFWEELKSIYANLEFHHSHGLGVLFMARALENQALKNFYAEFQQSPFLRDLFATVGNRLAAVEEGKLAMQQNDFYASARTNPHWIAKEYSLKNLGLAIGEKVKSKIGL